MRSYFLAPPFSHTLPPETLCAFRGTVIFGCVHSAVHNYAFRFIIAPMSTTPSPLRQSPHLRLHCVNVFVRDQDRSLRFFVDQLGFNVAFDTRVQSGERWVGVAPPDGPPILSLILPNPNSDQYKLIGRATQAFFATPALPSHSLELSTPG